MKNVRIVLLLFLVVLMTACSESSSTEYFLTVSPQSLSFSKDGGTQTISISCNTSWTIICEDTSVTIFPMSGNGDGKVLVTMGSAQTFRDFDSRIMIRTAEGKIENVTIHQEGIFIKGATLEIRNQGDIDFAGGKEVIDSLIIYSNMTWQLLGPDWIAAEVNGRWIPLSKTRATVTGGTAVGGNPLETVVYLKTVTANTSEEDREDIIVLEDVYDAGMRAEHQLTQLGKYAVAASQLMPLAYSIGCTWKCGIDVQEMYVCCVDHGLTNAELTPAEVMQWDVSGPNMIHGFDGLKPNTQYYLYGMAKVGNGVSGKILGRGIITGSDKNQPLANIVNASFDGTRHVWGMKRNEYCTYYGVWALFDEVFFSVPDGTLALYFENYQLCDFFVDEDYPGIQLENPNPVHIVTWGVDNEGYWSDLLTRYSSGVSSNTSKRIPEVRKRPRGMAVSVEDLKKAIKRIK